MEAPVTKRRIDDLMLQHIERFAGLQGMAPSTILLELAHLQDRGVYGDKKLPSRSTVERIVRDVQDRSVGKQWTFSDSTPEDAEIILNSRFFYYLFNRVWIDRITMDQAKWVIKVVKTVPNLPLELAWPIGFSYYLDEKLGRGLEGQDGFLAFRPWMSELNHNLYLEAVAKGHVEPFSPWHTVEEYNPSISLEERIDIRKRWETGESFDPTILPNTKGAASELLENIYIYTEQYLKRGKKNEGLNIE